MASVLTLAAASDVHADAVAWALRWRGHDVRLWDFAEFPRDQRATLRFAPDGDVAVAFPEAGQRQVHRVAPPAGVDVVWRRRPTLPVPSDELPASDQAVAMRESQVLCDASIALIGSAARWVNPLAPARAANVKPLQLRAALNAGLKIPDTLCSNDPDDVRRFAAEHGGRIIHKSFHPAGWTGGGKRYHAETALIGESVLGNDFALAAAPGIYQPYIEKKYELGVVMMGVAAISTKLSMPGTASLPVDARRVYEVAAANEVELPSGLQRACRRLMEELGLVFACLDLIATGDDEILFLEANEMGQFLWLEERNPEIPLLSVFADFIASGRPDFQRVPRTDGVSMAAYRQSDQHEQLRARAGAARRRARPGWNLPEPE